ncbi:hypothetical protein GpartN1_g3860.t1 [Galdieria partita]|uniref:BHLH domain-containing protein n=1 Tax=Galdieria partita TaxID=83374 RepID=A0A9C7UQL6_9RHOD|nr:hypothetical protein GpartN1_g3860.t1 [Galdieria partita]
MSSNKSSSADFKRLKHNIATKASRKKINDYLMMLLQLVSNGEAEVVPVRSKVRAIQEIIYQVKKLQDRVQLLETRLLLSDIECFEKWLNGLLSSQDVRVLPILTKACETVSQLSPWKIVEIWYANVALTGEGKLLERSEEVTLALANSFATKESGLGELQLIQGFLASSQQYHFLPDFGLPGIVYSSETPLWLNHLPSNTIFLRSKLARKFGVYSAVGVPFTLFGQIRAVLVFLDCVPREEDPKLTERLSVLFEKVSRRLEVRIERENSFFVPTNDSETTATFES